jgi:hypothetical protein
MEAFDRGDALHRASIAEPNVPENEDRDSDTMDGLEDLFTQVTMPLYPG